MLSPILLIFFSSSQSTSDLRTSGMQFEFGNHLVQNYDSVLNFESGFTDEITPMAMLSNSLIIAIGVGVLTNSVLSIYDADDELLSVDLGRLRIIKKSKQRRW